MDAAALIAALELVPHPEGGHYRRTWVDEHGSAIYYLLGPHESSRWHRVLGRTEIWHYYAGAPIELEVSAEYPVRSGVRTLRLGPRITEGEQPQAVVQAGAWQRARGLGEWSLVGCTVTPPFTFEAFELAPEA
jgi:hypothetical protein